MRISRSGACGNSPKNEFAEDIAISLAERDHRAFENNLTEDFRWVVAGETLSYGREAFLRQIEGDSPADAVTVFHVTTHGRVGAVNGELALRSGYVAFCHVIEFGDAKGETIKTITSYLVPLDYR